MTLVLVGSWQCDTIDLLSDVDNVATVLYTRNFLLGLLGSGMFHIHE